MNGLYLIIGFFLILHFSIFIGMFLDREKVKKLLRFLVSMVFELVFELGKTLLLAGVIGIYFIHEDKDFTKERLAKLSGGVVVINVGGYSDVEIKEKIDRVDDALGATRASLEEGFVPGGGITYLELYKALKELKLDT